MFFFALLLISGCNVFGGISPDDAPLYSGAEYTALPGEGADITVSEIPKESSGSLKTVILGDDSYDTYVLFSNLVDNSVTESSPSKSLTGTGFMDKIARFNSRPLSGYAGSRGITGSGDKVYSRACFDSDAAGSETVTDGDIKFWEVETDDGVNVTSGTREIKATCRKVVDKGSHHLSIWVADANWTGGSSSYKLTQEMVNALADSFLNPAGDRIYEWVTGIYGEEWGPQEFSNLITDYDAGFSATYPSVGADDDWITILLYDIENDGLPASGDGRIFGYFHALNNFIRTDQDDPIFEYSAERVMFSLDAALFATKDPDNAVWSIDDPWPQTLVSTLAHEFQHMICFYQKGVIQNPADGIDTWLNEMMSLATEDLLSDKMSVAGPRGVDPADGTAGTAPVYSNRLSYYLSYPDDSLVDWGELPYDYYQSYSTAYSYGAYLARNFDGARFVRAVQHSPYGDSRAIEDALQSVESYHAAAGDTAAYAGIGSLTFDDTVMMWGTANLLSDTANPLPRLILNKGNVDGGWFTDSLGYRLGSINLSGYYRLDENNYQHGYGLTVYSNPNYFPNSIGDYGHLYYHVGTSVNGTLDLGMSVPSTVHATLIRRR